MTDAARGALALALAGMGAAAAHVLVETPGEARDWRQTLPLAALVGAVLGRFGLAPRLRAGRGRAARAAGAALAAGGLAAFAAVFAGGHVAIETARGAEAGWAESLARAVAAVAGPGGLAALAFAALAGWLAGR